MRVIITGAAGFIGRQLTAALLARGHLTDSSGQQRPVTELILADQVAAPSPIAGSNGAGRNGGASQQSSSQPDSSQPSIRQATGNLSDPAFRARLFASPFDSVFHLAATLTTDAERDIAKGLEVNVLGMLDLLAACRALRSAGHPAPKLVFASSIATFGGALPEIVDDNTVQQPQTSYGVHKVIVEQLINDHSRHGIVDGRALRLPIVLMRPPGAAPSVSDAVAAVTRTPLLGQDVSVPFKAETVLPVVSVQAVTAGLLAAHDLPATVFGASRALNLPALSVSVAEMLEALSRVGRGRKLGQIGWREDAAVQRIVDGWPKRFESALARQHGILPDESFDAILQSFLASYEAASAAAGVPA